MRIALISDLHFGKLSATKELSVPGEAIDDDTHGGVPLNAGFEAIIREQDVEYLFVLGDLTSTGSPVEYSRCIKQIYTTADAAGILKSNVIIAVGNHDIDRRIAKISQDWAASAAQGYPIEEATRYYQLVAASHGEIHAEHLVFDTKGPVPFSGIVERDGILIFVLNSGWLCSQDVKTRHGKLDQEQLSWCKQQIEQHADDPRWKILLLHHHPYNYPYAVPGYDSSLLEEGAELLEIAGAGGINVICHGHRHHPKVQNDSRDGWKNPITFLCAGSFSVNAKHRSAGTIPNVFHILELACEKSEKIATVFSYQYSISNGWQPILQNCPETPIDDVMVFHRYYSETEVQNIFLSLLPKSIEPYVELPCWNRLPLQLRTLRYTQLNLLIEGMAVKDYKIIGKYPNPVVLIRRGQ